MSAYTNNYPYAPTTTTTTTELVLPNGFSFEHPHDAYPSYPFEHPALYWNEPCDAATLNPLSSTGSFSSLSAGVHPSALQAPVTIEDPLSEPYEMSMDYSDMSDPLEWLPDFPNMSAYDAHAAAMTQGAPTEVNPAHSMRPEAAISTSNQIRPAPAPHHNHPLVQVSPPQSSVHVPPQVSPSQPSIQVPPAQGGLQIPPQAPSRPSYTGRVSPTPSRRRPSPLHTSRPRPPKGAKAKGADIQPPTGDRKRACVACRHIKGKCEWADGDDASCVRCKQHGKECMPVDAKPKGNNQTLTSLKNQILAREEQIKQFLELLDGPRSSRSDRQLSGVECDCPPASNSSGGQTHKAGCHVTDPMGLYTRARLMDLLDPDGSEDEDEEASSEDERRRSPVGMHIPLPLVPSGTPVGMFFELSLSLGSPSPSSEHPPLPNDSADVGLAGADYFTPGPAARPEIRRIIIERERLPAYLVKGHVKPEECLELFADFMKYWNVSVSVLDPELHTAKSVLARCPFLFTVVLAIAARDYHKRDLYQLLMQEAKTLCGLALVEWWKSVEIVQAFILLAVFPAPARRWDEDKTWMYLGCAIRLATELDLNRPVEGPFASEMAERESLNRVRTWLICHNLEVSAAAKLGKLTTIQEDSVIASSKSWWRTSKYHTKFDVHLCAFTQILLIFHKYYRMLLSDPNAPGDYNAHMDIGALAVRFSEEVETFQTRFERIFAEESDPEDPACRYRAHVRYTAHYFRLVIYSICHRKMSARGIQDPNPMLLRCMDVASKLVKAFTDHHAHSVYFKYSAEGWFTFGAFAAAFMIKLLGPTFAGTIDNDRREHLRGLVMQLITAFMSPEVSIDPSHTPSIYGRFLSKLLSRADELNGIKPVGSVPGSGAGGSGRPTAYSPAPKSEMEDLWGLPPLQNMS